EPIIVPSQDVVLGLYYMTRERVNAKGEGMVFANVTEVRRAYEGRSVALHAKVKVRVTDREFADAKPAIVDTTVGRALLSEILPDGLPLGVMSTYMTHKAISGLINRCYSGVGLKETVVLADQLMITGFAYATRAGVSIGVDDMVVTTEKARILGIAEAVVKEIE